MTRDEEILIKRIETGMATVKDAKRVRELIGEKEDLAAKLQEYMEQRLIEKVRAAGRIDSG